MLYLLPALLARFGITLGFMAMERAPNQPAWMGALNADAYRIARAQGWPHATALDYAHAMGARR
jgi:hypothetical protein